MVDDAMIAIEAENPPLKGVLPKNYARPGLDKQRLVELIDLISTIGLGEAENRSKDILESVYKYFLSEFASVEGKKGGQFYPPAVWCECWLRCSRHTVDGFMTRAAVLVECLFRLKFSLRRTPDSVTISLSTGRNRTQSHDSWL